MATTMTIPENYQLTYGDMWEGKLQQKTNRLRQYASIANNCRGRYKTIEQINSIDLEQKTSRFQKTELVDVETTRRFIFPQTYQKAVGFDEDDGWKLGQLNVPIMESATQLYQGAQRRMEKILIDGIDGTNTIGNGADEAQTTVVLPSTQIVAVNYVESGTAANSDLTLGKLRESLRILQVSEAFGQDTEDGAMAVCALGAKQLNSLLREEKLTSSDYAQVKALVNGEINTAFGYRFVRTEQLNVSSNIRNVLVWAKDQVCFGLWDNYKSRLSIRDDLSEATQYRVKFSAGSCRKEEGGTVRILCDETA